MEIWNSTLANNFPTHQISYDVYINEYIYPSLNLVFHETVVQELSSKYDTVKAELHENETHTQLGNLERKWQHHEQNNFVMKECILLQLFLFLPSNYWITIVTFQTVNIARATWGWWHLSHLVHGLTEGGGGGVQRGFSTRGQLQHQ